MLRLGVLVSGGGTNLQAIIDGISSGRIRDTQISVVISNRKDAYALTRAEENGIKKTAVILVGEALSPEAFDRSKLYDPEFTTGFRKGTKA